MNAYANHICNSGGQTHGPQGGVENLAGGLTSQPPLPSTRSLLRRSAYKHGTHFEHKFWISKWMVCYTNL